MGLQTTVLEFLRQELVGRKYNNEAGETYTLTEIKPNAQGELRFHTRYDLPLTLRRNCEGPQYLDICEQEKRGFSFQEFLRHKLAETTMGQARSGLQQEIEGPN
jgi:hypothetical protein